MHLKIGFVVLSVGAVGGDKAINDLLFVWFVRSILPRIRRKTWIQDADDSHN